MSSRECATVTNVQRYSLHDGGGIRTVAFLKGCPFKCPWCCNPENLSFDPEVSWHKDLCIGCSVRADGGRDSNGCPCDVLPEACPTGAKKLEGRIREVFDLADELLRDEIFFKESNGGVTLSGGECMATPELQRFSASVLSICHAKDIKTAIETTLGIPLIDPAGMAFVCDTFLVDFKIADRKESLRITGIDPAVRDCNVRRLLKEDAHIIARMPLIPGFTSSLENAQKNVEDIVGLGIARVDILPFHQLGANKYGALGLKYECEDLRQLSEKEIAAVEQICQNAGLKTVRHGE